MAIDNTRSINANPTKKFFIDMLVRDIALEPAIAELVDNSLDGARKFMKMHENENYQIEVKFSKDQFSIFDTCGGITIEDARNYCFRFGRDADRAFDLENGTGVFGIGMKRALFRMGKIFDIESTTPTEYFHIHIDVDEWIKDEKEDWTFEFDDLRTGENNPRNICGTKITVKSLHTPISSSFANPYFEEAFFKYIQRRSSMLKELNVVLLVNNRNVFYADEKILFSDTFKPYVKSYEMDGVSTKIIVGCAKLGEPKKAGWYVQCNGRIVLFANQGEETGWGTEDIRPFHVSFAAFRGYVLFESSHLEKLPWNTTKTGVDMSSKYYQRALDDMRDCERLFISWRNQVEDFLKVNEYLNTSDIFSGSEQDVFSKSVMDYSKCDSQFGFPKLSSENYPVPPEPKSLISFKEDKKKVDLVKENLGNCRMTNREMGEKIFDYYYQREIDEDE